jgi:hypothetical protein
MPRQRAVRLRVWACCNRTTGKRALGQAGRSGCLFDCVCRSSRSVRLPVCPSARLPEKGNAAPFGAAIQLVRRVERSARHQPHGNQPERKRAHGQGHDGRR